MVAFTHLSTDLSHESFVFQCLCSFTPLQFLAWIIHSQRSPSSATRHNTITFSTSQPSPKFVENDTEQCSGCINELKAHEVGKTNLVPRFQPSHLSAMHLFHDSAVWAAFYSLVSFKQTDGLSYFLHKLFNFVANHAKKWPAATDMIHLYFKRINTLCMMCRMK